MAEFYSHKVGCPFCDHTWRIIKTVPFHDLTLFQRFVECPSCKRGSYLWTFALAPENGAERLETAYLQPPNPFRGTQ